MKRSKFALSNTKLFSCDLGELIPCGLFEVLPGDSIQQATNMLIRCSPLLAPVMHPVHCRIHHWFVPYRLIWTNFEKFITGGPDGLDATVYPTRNSGLGLGTLSDYLGLPPTGPVNWSDLPFRAYNLIWNENYRDQDLETAVAVNKGDGLSNATSDVLQNCAWEKDYFTSARPWEQKGPTITIPLGTTAPVVSNAANMQQRNLDTIMRAVSTNATGQLGLTGAVASANVNWGPDGTNTTGLRTDLSAASAVTVNLLRQALGLQRFEEARARFGSRYVEYLRYLGVQSSDARLQRPEYLGGGSQTISFSEVLQTAPGADPVGDLKGHGITGLRSNRYRRYIEEHGLVMSLFSVRPKTIYMQGMPRMWNRRTKEDFWQRELEHIGQQAIRNKEIYAPSGTPDATFGYQDRYDEYRRQESSVSGEFRTILNHWHLAREFSSAPALNATFVKSVPTERTFAVPSEDVLWIQARHNIQARRLLSQKGSSFIY